jgi:cytochrome c-type biogenesis protein CcmH
MKRSGPGRWMTLWLAALLTLAFGVHAKDAAPLAADPAIERRLNAIAEELRCLVCQNESLAGSRSDLALDLRREIRDLIRQGKSDDEVRDFMVSRYGDFVLYRPPVKPTTWLLWGGPFVLLVAGMAGLVVFLRRRQPLAGGSMSDDERRKVAALLDGEA